MYSRDVRSQQKSVRMPYIMPLTTHNNMELQDKIYQTVHNSVCMCMLYIENITSFNINFTENMAQRGIWIYENVTHSCVWWMFHYVMWKWSNQCQTHTHTHTHFMRLCEMTRDIEVFWKKCKTSFLRATFSISVATFSHKICNILLWMKWNNENCDIYIRCVQCEWKCPFAKNVLKSHIIVS